MEPPLLWTLVDAGPPGTKRPPAVVARRVVRADTFGARLRGLLGRDGLADDEGLWLEPCDSVHTFFMRFPIDVAFVDRHGTVVRRLDGLRPWRATRLHTGARACVELAAGTLARCGVEAGSRLRLVAAGAGREEDAPRRTAPG